MQSFEFEALGTHWSLQLDSADFPVRLQTQILSETQKFERRFSRFIEGSEVTALRTAPAGTYPISEDFAKLLTAAQLLRELSNGGYDPVVGTVLEEAGYDQNYSFHSTLTPNSQPKPLPTWSVSQQKVTISRGVLFDLGGIGKGYWIDQLSQILIAAGFQHHLVDGGGDMMATTKGAGEGWRVALEWPGKPELAVGVVELRNQGLAVSDVFRRRWQNWHHLVSAKTQQPVAAVIGCMAVAPTAFLADQTTSAIIFSDPAAYPKITTTLQSQYLVLREDQTAQMSNSWPGEFF